MPLTLGLGTQAKNQHPNLDPSLGLTLRVAQKSVSRQKV